MGINQQETRVRLSAEGVAEIVAAFKKTSEAGKEAAHETSEAFKELNEQLAEVGKSLLAGLSIVVAADKLKELFKETLETAEGLTRLTRQTGLSTDAIQGMQRAAKENGSSVEAANAGIQKFTLSVGKAEIGSKQTAEALGDLGISVKQLNALSPDERLKLVAQRLSEVHDNARRSRDEVELFGKGGAELDQALIKLGEEGLATFINKARELGTFIDADMVTKLAHVKDQLDDVASVARGLGQQFLVGIAPALGQVASSFTKATEGGEGFRVVGVALGVVLKALALTVETVGKLIGVGWAVVMNHLEAAAEATSLAIHGHFIKASQEALDAFKRDATIARDFGADIAASFKQIFAEQAEEETRGGGGGEGDRVAQLAAFNHARLQLLNERLDTELKLTEAQNQLTLENEKSAFDKGVSNLQEYFKKRAALTEADFAARIATARAKLANLQALEPTANTAAEEEQQRAEQAKLEGEIRVLEAQRELAVKRVHVEMDAQTEALQRKQQEAQIKLLEIEGKRTEAARERLKLTTQELQKELAQSGAPPTEVAAAINTANSQGNAKINFDAAHTKAQADLLNLETQRKTIQDQINSGQLFSLEGTQRQLALEQQMLPELQADAAAMKKFADAANDQQLQSQAAAYKEKLDAISASVQNANSHMKELKDGLQSSVGQGLSTFLNDAIVKSKSLGQAFDDAAKQILADLLKMALKIEEEKVLSALFSGSLFGGGGGGGGSLFSSGSSTVTDTAAGTTTTFASGGLVRGPGTTTSDSIPALLSDKEFVVNAQATSRPGMLGFLHALNQGIGAPRIAIPRFALGGSVSSSLGATGFVGGGGNLGQPVQLHVSPDALHLTLRDWFEREVAHINSTR